MALGTKRVQMCDLHQDAAETEGCIPIKDCAMTGGNFLMSCANFLEITEELESDVA